MKVKKIKIKKKKELEPFKNSKCSDYKVTWLKQAQ